MSLMKPVGNFSDSVKIWIDTITSTVNRLENMKANKYCFYNEDLNDVNLPPDATENEKALAGEINKILGMLRKVYD